MIFKTTDQFTKLLLALSNYRRVALEKRFGVVWGGVGGEWIINMHISSGEAGGIAARGQIYLGAPISVLEIHLRAKLLPLAADPCSTTAHIHWRFRHVHHETKYRLSGLRSRGRSRNAFGFSLIFVHRGITLTQGAMDCRIEHSWWKHSVISRSNHVLRLV